MTSIHLKTPVQTHPLLTEEVTATRGRRSRQPSAVPGEAKPKNDYFALKAQLEQDSASHAATWDGSVRGYGRSGPSRKPSGSPSSRKPPAASVFDSPSPVHQPPNLPASGPQENTLGLKSPPDFLITSEDDSLTPMLATRWHELTDEGIQGAIANVSMAGSYQTDIQRYQAALRTLSAAYQSLCRTHLELEEKRRALVERETARRQRAEEFLKETQPSELDVAKRLFQSLFTDDDELKHRVQRKQSAVVRAYCLSSSPSHTSLPSQSISDSLLEALGDDVLSPKAASEPTLEPTPEEDEGSGTPILSSSAPSVAKAADPSLASPRKRTTSTLSLGKSPPLASLGDWMGTLWGKGKQRPRLLLENDKQSATPSTESSNDPVTIKPPQQRKSAKSVFGTLGINVLNPSFSTPSQSLTPTEPKPIPNTDDSASIRSNVTNVTSRSASQSMLSSPIQTSFLPSLAAPLVTTSLDDSAMLSGQSTKPSSVAEEPPRIRIQGASLRAITNAARVMTSDPNSILADTEQDISPVIAQLAMDLVRFTRDQGVFFHDRPKDRKDLLPPLSLEPEKTGPVVELSSSTNVDAASALSRTLTKEVESKRKRTTRGSTFMSPAFTSPLLSTLLGQPSRKSAHPSDKSTSHDPSNKSIKATHGNASPAAAPAKPLSVPLESIIPHIAKPPTQYLSRTYTPITAKDFHFTIPLPNSASRFTIYNGDKNQRPLTDRFGFMYDVSQYDVLLLLRGKECGNTAPACLTGVKIADREETNLWPEDDNSDQSVKPTMEIIKDYSCPCTGELDAPVVNPVEASSPAVDTRSIKSAKSASSSKSKRPSTLHSVTGGSSSLATSMTSILSVNDDTPRHACAKTVRRLLDQLTEIHDQQQETQRREWDAFVRQRSKAKVVKSSGAGAANMTNYTAGAASILGLETSLDEDELSHTEGLIGFSQLAASPSARKEFDKLIRSGIPLVYRSKVWMECSGALDMKEPGLFRDLLAEVDGDDGVALEIEKDVGRTMPLNIFFGGDGAGVDKLRRVLIAYSRYVAPPVTELCSVLTRNST